MCAAQKKKKVIQKRSSRLAVKDQSDVSNLQILVKNLQELHRWQNHLLEELARQAKKLAATDKK